MPYVMRVYVRHVYARSRYRIFPCYDHDIDVPVSEATRVGRD